MTDNNDNELDIAKNFSQTGSERTIQDIISKLRFISKIKANEKINVKNLFVRNNELISQRLIRTIRNISQEDGESKESTLLFLDTVTDEAINLICIYSKSNDTSGSPGTNSGATFNNNIASLIISNLEEAIKGMQSLLETYKDDRNFTSKIEALMGTLTVRIHTLQRKGVMGVIE